jgi:threonine dehydratase
LECWQHTGSFKVRGAISKLASLGQDELARGLVTASAGNHGIGLSYASAVLCLPKATIFVPESAPKTKVERLESLGSRIHKAGHDYDGAHASAVAYAHERGALYVSAYDDPVVIAGQGTVGMEILKDLPNENPVILVPVGGGGIVAGIALAARALGRAARILGLQPESSPSAFLSLRDGVPYETYDAGPTICDGLAGGFGRLPFELAGNLMERVLVVPERKVRRAVAWLLANEQILVEGSGAIAITPLLDQILDLEGETVVCVLTGRNIDASLVSEILGEQEKL